MKRVICLMIFLSMNSTLFLGGCADDETPSQEVYYDSETGEYVANLYAITEDGLKPISFEEWEAHRKQERLNAQFEQPSTSLSAIQSQAVLSSFYTETIKYYNVMMPSYPVSNPFYCDPGAVSCSTTYTVSKTETETFSANADTTVKQAIRISASFSWSTSASTQVAYGLTIPPGKTGQIMFAPYFNQTYGYADEYLDGWYAGTVNVSGNSPVKLQTGMLAGYVWTKIY